MAFWYDKNVFAEGLIELCKKFKFDGILVSLHGHYDNWKDKLVKSEQIDRGNIKLTFENRTEVPAYLIIMYYAFIGYKAGK